jgi:hypothetical protein
MDIISRTTFVITNVLLSYVLYKDIILALISGIGILIWLMKTWGKYWIAFDPQVDTYLNRKGIGFIDKFVDKVYGNPLDKKDVLQALRNWGTIGFSLRGFIFSIPLFIALAIYYNNYYLILLSAPMLLQGLYYRWVNIYYSFKYSEMLTGYTYSSLILISYLIGK